MSRPADYSSVDLKKALEGLPLCTGDVVFSHSNLGFFGKQNEKLDADSICEMFFDAVMECIGDNGTIVVPTFTYSFPRQEIFDPQQTPSAMGVFAEWVRKHPDSFRSVDPSYSVAAIGKQADTLTRDCPENSFSEDGFFGRFHKIGGKIFNLNFDAGSTFLHYVERELECGYRFDKTFEGIVEQGGKQKKVTNTIYVRYLSSDATEPVFENFDRLVRDKKMYISVKLGRGEMGVISSHDCYEVLRQTFPDRPWLLTKAEAMGSMPELQPEAQYKSMIEG